mmetsp:Transcript_34899/g.108566  ORF Transcript_34899/g.108566 Transcript_34899/m.108566 type:complete len:232 (-) Transcript_34899:83-778(-)
MAWVCVVMVVGVSWVGVAVRVPVATHSPELKGVDRAVARRLPHIGNTLVLVGTDATCSPGQTLKTGQAATVFDAATLCGTTDACNLFVWQPAGDVRLCGGHQAILAQGEAAAAHVTGVRAELFRAPGYEAFVNYQGVCDGPHVIGEEHGVFSFEEAARRCDAQSACSYFTLSTVAGLDGIRAGNANTAWLCKGNPRFVFHLGWLGGGKTESLPPRPRADQFDAFDGPLEAA